MSRRWQIVALLLLVFGASYVMARALVTRLPIRRANVTERVREPMRRNLPARERRTEHVVIVSVDGLRADAISRFEPPTMTRLAREGAVSLRARTIRPSVTLPSHASMLTGTAPGVHGIRSNEEAVRGKRLAAPTIFAVAERSGLRAAAFFSETKTRHMEALLWSGVSHPPGGPDDTRTGRTADRVARYLADARPNLVFVHLSDPDSAGHATGWMTPAYAAAVRAADQALGEIVAAADRAFGAGNYVLILTADHGGHGRTHGSQDATDMTIPWIAWGAGVRGGTTLPRGIRTMDTAATALWLLGVRAPSQMVGRPVGSAFRER